MACNTCRSACGDCPEAGITFQRGPRPVLPQAAPTKPPASPVTVPVAALPTQEVAA